MDAWHFCLVAGVIVLAIYLVILIRLRATWIKGTRTTGKTSDVPYISVVIPFRNENYNLPRLISALQGQNYPADRFEVVAVDDHSTDGTVRIVVEQTKSSPNFRIILNDSAGKKGAIKTGIELASGNLITTIDADCVPTRDWLGAIAGYYESSKPAMLIGPVRMSAGSSLFSKFQSLDFLALQVIGAAAAMQGGAVYCSGANLSFEKGAWTSAQESLNGQEIASGDDVFLLHSFKKMGLQVVFVADKNAMVTTGTEKTVKAFMSQRARWGEKSIHYKDKRSIALAVIVLFTNLFLLISLAASIVSPVNTLLLLLPFVIKSTADYLVLESGKNFFDIKLSLLPYLLFSSLYPFYLILTALVGLTTRVSWKGRKL